MDKRGGKTYVYMKNTFISSSFALLKICYISPFILMYLSELVAKFSEMMTVIKTIE